MISELKCTVDIKLIGGTRFDATGNRLPNFTKEKIPAILDFGTQEIYCKLLLNVEEFFAAINNLHVYAIEFQYKNKLYHATLNEKQVQMCRRSGGCSDGTTPVALDVTFLFQHGILYLSQEQESYSLVFCGARKIAVDEQINYQGQTFHILSNCNDGTITISSSARFNPDVAKLFKMAFSLFQNAELASLERHEGTQFELYLNTPKVSGAALTKDIAFFFKLWGWLQENRRFDRLGNAMSFFWVGARITGELLEFRTINLFVTINAICGPARDFGDRIYQVFEISLADGRWLAQVRNNLVHEGKSMGAAIAAASDDFHRKWPSLQLDRCKRYENPDLSQKPTRLYFDIISLITDYIKKQCDYDGHILHYEEIYHVE